MSDSSSGPSEPSAYIATVRAEIEAEAELRRRQDPDVQRRERELERAWIDVAPPGAAGQQNELLLDRADRLSMIDVDAPLGSKPAARYVKGTVRRATYWYLRYITDQVNALNNVLVRLVRRLDDRLGAVEAAVSTSSLDGLIDPVAEPSEAVAAVVADMVPDTVTVFVASSGGGTLVRSLQQRGQQVVGIDRDAMAILPGVRDGLDLRAGDPLEQLRSAPDGSLGAVVLAGFIEDMAPIAARSLIEDALRATTDDGVVVVVSADPAERGEVERDLRGGRGLAPATWAHLMERCGASARLIPVDNDPRIREIVIARRR